MSFFLWKLKLQVVVRRNLLMLRWILSQIEGFIDDHEVINLIYMDINDYGIRTRHIMLHRPVVRPTVFQDPSQMVLLVCFACIIELL